MRPPVVDPFKNEIVAAMVSVKLFLRAPPCDLPRYFPLFSDPCRSKHAPESTAALIFIDDEFRALKEISCTSSLHLWEFPFLARPFLPNTEPLARLIDEKSEGKPRPCDFIDCEVLVDLTVEIWMAGSFGSGGFTELWCATGGGSSVTSHSTSTESMRCADFFELGEVLKGLGSFSMRAEGF